MARPLRVLVVEDRPTDAELVVLELRRAGFTPEWQRVDTEADYLANLRPELDIILSDYNMPEFSALQALEVLQQSGLGIPLIIISGTIGEDTAVAAMKKGAVDYLLKDRLTRLGPAVEQAVEKGRLRRERAKAELALRESEERFREVVQNIGEVFWMTNLEKNEMLFISAAYEKVWGRTCASLYASPMTWLEAIHPEDRDRVLEAASTKQIDGTYHEEYRIVRPDGSIRWINDRAFPVRKADGAVYRVAGVARDITERKKAEEALQHAGEVLRESERRFREMLENVQLVAMTLDRNGMITFCNAYFLKITGWKRDEVLGADWFSKFVPGNPEVKALFFNTVESGTIPPHYENPIKIKNGEIREIVWNNTMLRGSSGNFIGTASIGEDVTERKRAEERLLQQAQMLDQAHGAIIVRDFESKQIAFWNHGAERLYGWGAAEVLGRDMGEQVYADPGVREVVIEQLLQTGTWHGEQQHLSKSGRKLIVSSNATLVRDAAGHPKSVLLINVDVTEQKALEARFLRAQRMESIGTLASGVAHDLNNILSPIMMSVPLLRRNLSAEQRDGIISNVETCAERGAQIVKQVLTFGRGLEGDRRLLHPEALIGELTKIMHGTFPKNLLIECVIDPQLWLVTGDATQLHQVLLNLCVNARDAMPDGGTLRLRAANLDVDASYASTLPAATPGRYVVLEVNDTGCGMPPEIVELIFEPFFTTKGVGKGTGLGLSTTYGIVKGHGGFIHVASTPGKGTTFRVYLPAAAREDAMPDGPSSIGPPQGQEELVLVVDDEAAVRQSARMVLEAHGYRVLVAADGTDALAVFAQNTDAIATVLTDIMMPHMDGIALMHALRRMKPGVPLIASTGLGDTAQAARLKTAAVEFVLYKPYDANRLLGVIHEALHPEASSPTHEKESPNPDCR